ncbi:site-specific DNA-methyltransferase [Clostridium manihotivorum]|uniref:Site-specific DNA-methyltransferase n=1 Tax=Clostridium manihotivorum TaxID=2320868 RepID=A0A3R5WZE8_9CLOT|nr:site-specific DNA-methyltransferase [Clostridium manihotivorum]QAA30356.1 site-specific DNA-methyltransferase [Clostridium manihotivorum]
MTNISKKKREDMIYFLTQLRELHNDDASIIAFNEIQAALTEKKYGLVWEEHTERVDEELKTKIPVFTEVKEKKINLSSSEEYNFLLEGDNLHSLYLLEKTHLGMIDVIYIDPPYNTGNKDFRYDDDYVDEEDGFRHSKWLSFMSKRLWIAKSLLSKDGIIFISIDDNEQAQLKMLADTILGENNFIIEMPRQTKKSGKTTGSFSKNHDYVLVYVKENKDVFMMQEHIDDDYKNEDEFVDERGKYKLNQTLDYDSLTYSSSMDYPLEVEGEVFYPGGDYEKYIERQKGNHKRADWAWRWNKKLFDFGYDNGFIVIKRKNDGTARIYTKTYLNAKIKKDKKSNYYIDYEKKTKPMSSIELTENTYSNDRAKKDLAFFGLEDEFDYSKPVELIKTLIKCHKNKDAIVLDFFAGSGTTGQATLIANVEDGGNRKFILCTNNENGICENITYKRLHDTITKFQCSLETSELLYEASFNQTLLKNANNVLSQIDTIKKENKEKFDKVNVSFEDKKLAVYGINIQSVNDGIKANLKYFKTGYVNKFDDQDAVISDELSSYISEMVELENGIDLATDYYKLIISEDCLEDFVTDISAVKKCSKVYMSSEILLTAKQERVLKENEVEINIIPDYYFANELREVGEL